MTSIPSQPLTPSSCHYPVGNECILKGYLYLFILLFLRNWDLPRSLTPDERKAAAWVPAKRNLPIRKRCHTANNNVSDHLAEETNWDKDDKWDSNYKTA